MQYNTRDQYKRITRMLGLMDDFKVGAAHETHLPDTLSLLSFSLSLIEWRATYRIPRHCIVLLQQTSRAPSAECQLEGLWSIVELTALASIRLPIVINAPRAPTTANQLVGAPAQCITKCNQKKFRWFIRKLFAIPKNRTRLVINYQSTWNNVTYNLLFRIECSVNWWDYLTVLSLVRN